jgi:hypothetical protein
MRRLPIFVYQFFILTDLQPQIPTFATRGAGGLAQAHTQAFQTPPSVRPKRPNCWTSPLAKVKRPRIFIACTVNLTPQNAGFYSFVFQIYHACMRRELPCSIHTHIRKPNLAHSTRHPRLQIPSNKSRKIRLCGTLLSNMPLGMSTRALPERGVENDVCSEDKFLRFF